MSGGFGRKDDAEAGIVDEDVDAGFAADPLDARRDRRRIFQIDDGMAVVRPEALGQARRLGDVDEDEPRSGLGEGFGHRRADAAGSAGDDGGQAR